jgi:hypothetical protein
VTTSSSPSGRPSATYTEALYWRVRDGSGRLVKINLLALPLAAVFGLGFVWMAQYLGKAPKLAWGARDGVVFVIGIVGVLALHECVHGLLMRAFGARPRYGFYARGGMFYAKAPGYRFTRRQYLIVVLGPLVGLSLLACAGIGLLAGTSMVWYVALWGVVNASAANADSWIAAVVLQHPADAHVVDELDGLRVLVPSGGSTRSAQGG